MADAVVEQLRNEILECQKTRSRFMQWKLVLIAAIGSAALGLRGREDTAGVPALLGLIPLVCLYVDSVCVHNESKIMMIAAFLRGPNHGSETARQYELMCQQHRGEFRLEGIALFASSAVLSFIVMMVGLLSIWPSGLEPVLAIDRSVALLLVLSGGAGTAAALWFQQVQRKVQSFPDAISDSALAAPAKDPIPQSPEGTVPPPSST